MKTAEAPIPQLRIRTEFSYRRTFAPVAQVAARLKELSVPAAGIVDPGTWGHVRWAKEAGKAGFRPLFGTEVEVPTPDGRKPTAWALALDSKGFYHFSSAVRAADANVSALFDEHSKHLLRFSGGALSDPALFDYVDLNPSSRWATAAALKLAKKTRKPLVLTSDNWYAAPSDRSAFAAIGGREGMTPQHILNKRELEVQFDFLTKSELGRAIVFTREAAQQCTSELAKAPLIQVPGDLRALAIAGRDRRLRLGHLERWSAHYRERFERELKAIAEKKFESYFIVVADLIAWAKERMLVGPGRGSSAGSLVCYCLGITEVDPIPHDLLFERFIDLTREDLPDIDIDFSDTKRELVFDYLSDKYGRECVSRIGNINTLKPRSALAEVCKRLGIPDKARFDFVNVLVEYSSGDARYGHSLEDTMKTTEAGAKFERDHANAAAIVRQVENHAWHTGVHAAGVIVCNVPVTDYCTVDETGVAQVDKPDSEYLNLLKIDALGLRTLGIIEDSGVVTADQLYALKLDDPAVLSIFDERKFCGVFQFEGQAQRSVSMQVKADAFRTLDHVTALARPGPLGGGAANKYIDRKAGREEVTYTHHALRPILSDTYGVVLYQEQVMRIVREIGKFSWAETTTIRKAMSGRKGREYFDKQGEKFIAGAAQDKISESTAKQIWHEICSFGAWGMNKSHTCAYAMISYWCAWMKRYHPLEYAAACLRSAKDDEQTLAILREMADEGVEYVPFDINNSVANWSVQNGKLIGGFLNLVGFGPAKSAAAIEARAANKMTPALTKRIGEAKCKFADLYPIRRAYADIIRNPEACGCRRGSRVTELKDLPESGDVLIIGRVVKKQLRDENETRRIERRNGKVMKGLTLFADVFVSDDSGGPVTIRINRFSFDPIGRRACENLVANQDVVMVRGRRVPNFNMISMDNMRCLTNPEALK